MKQENLLALASEYTNTVYARAANKTHEFVLLESTNARVHWFNGKKFYSSVKCNYITRNVYNVNEFQEY